MDDVDLETASGRAKLAAWLYDRREGELAKPIGDLVEGWTAERGKCHDNVERWLDFHPYDCAVRGWLVITYLTAPNRIRFVSHSVIESAGGELADVTLSETDGRHAFIRHPGPEKAFLDAVRDQGLPSIDHVLWPDEPLRFEYWEETEQPLFTAFI